MPTIAPLEIRASWVEVKPNDERCCICRDFILLLPWQMRVDVPEVDGFWMVNRWLCDPCHAELSRL